MTDFYKFIMKDRLRKEKQKAEENKPETRDISSKETKISFIKPNKYRDLYEDEPVHLRYMEHKNRELMKKLTQGELKKPVSRSQK